MSDERVHDGSANEQGDQQTDMAHTMWTHRRPLHTLIMSVNELFALDKRVSEFRDLQNLDVQSNQLTSLPSSFSQLQHLTSLNLARNALSRIPSCVLALTSLVSLDLSDNMLDTLWSQADAEKAGIAASDVLRSLATLNLAYNCLSTDRKSVV